MKKLPYLLAPAALVSLAAGFFACGSYSSPPSGTAGGSPTGTGGDSTGSAGATVNPSGGSQTTGGDASGGSDPTPNGGSGNDTSGGSSSGGASGAAGGSVANGGATTNGGTGGAGGAGGGSAGAPPVAVALPCAVLSDGGTKCVAAHSTVRVIVPGYTGPLYQVCKGTANIGPSSCKGTPQDIGAKDGYADAALQDSFCGTGACKITKIYDQSGMKNDLEPAPAGGVASGRTPDQPADAAGLKVTINGHSAYGIQIRAGMGYRTGCSGCNIKTGNGMATGDQPETEYWVTSGVASSLKDSCCFDYGNAETTANDDGNGTMEALYMGGGVVWGTGAGGKPGPWVMADLENGLYAGWDGDDQGIATNTALKSDFVTGILLGDTAEKNNNAGRFALFGGDATTGVLKTMYDGIRPAKTGYRPMKKQGSIILGIGGDNSRGGEGRFYEGAIATGPVASKQTIDTLQAAIVATKYGK